jgi:hypothetical protein
MGRTRSGWRSTPWFCRSTPLTRTIALRIRAAGTLPARSAPRSTPRGQWGEGHQHITWWRVREPVTA